MKYLFFILLLFGGVASAQTTYYIQADSTRLRKVGANNELIVENGTRTRTGAYLKNTLNGRTGFFYAVDSAYISGSNLVLVRGGGTQNVTVAIGTAGNVWSITGNSGTAAGTNFIGTTDNVGLMFKTNNVQSGLISGDNTSIGYESLLNNSGGFQNVAFGYGALKSATFPIGNVAIGYNALNLNLTGSSNIAVGIDALKNNTASGNVAVGNSSLKTNTSGSGNTAIGQAALQLNLTGTQNTAVGVSAGYGLTKGGNSAFGFNALSNAADTGFNNVAIGGFSLLDNISGSNNVAVGVNALLVNTTGEKNTAIGAGAMENNISGSQNTFVGQDAGLNVTVGSYNIGVGWNAKTGAKGIGNSALGFQSATSIGDTSSYNVFVGYNSGYNGSQADSVYNSIALGAHSYTTASNQLSVSDSISRLTFTGVSRGAANYVMTDSLGTGQYWVARPVGAASSVPLSGITAATGTNSINNGNHPQTWSWNTLDGVGLFLTSSSTVATGGTVLFGAQMTGAHSTSGITSTALDISNLHSGTTSINVGISSSAQSGTTNIAGKFEALSGTNNYAIIVPSGGGSVGIGTSTPSAILHSVGTARFDLGSDATGDIFYRDASGFLTRLPIGTAAQTLHVVGGLPAWRDTATGGGGGVTTMAAIGATPNANGATISGVTLNLQPADGSFGGVVTTAAQTFAGLKTFGAITQTGQYINSLTGAASTPSISITGNPYTAGTATTNHPLHYMNGGTAPTTWSTAGTYMGTNAVSGFTGNFLDYHVNGGTSVAKVDYEGTGVFKGVTIGKYGGATGVSQASGDMYFYTGSGALIYTAGSAGQRIEIAGAGAYTQNSLIYGGNTAYTRMGSNLSIFGSSGETRLGAGGTENYVTIQTDGDVGIGQTSPAARLDILKTTEQLRLGYDASNYYSTTVGSTGGVTFNAVGAGSAFTFSDNLDVTGVVSTDGLNADRTITAGGTTGNQTINKMAGTVNFAAAATTLTVTNSLVDANSIIFCVVRTNDATATIKNVVPGSGSFVITLTAAATAETSVGFIVTN